MRLLIPILTCAAAACLGVLAFATVSPSEGTIGTEFTARFDQDVGTKPKIVLTFEGAEPAAKSPKAKAKLISSDGTDVTFVIQAAKGSGTFAVGAKGTDASGGSLVIAPPDLQEWSPDPVAAGGEMELLGDHFGALENKRNAPKVYVGGKRARVTSFSNTALTIVLSKKTPEGLQDIRVVNKVGESVAEDAVTVTAPPRPIKGADSLSARVNGKKFVTKLTRKTPEAAVAVFNAPVGSLQLTAVKTSGNPRKKLSIQQFNILFQTGVNDLANLTLPAVFTSPGLVTYSETETVIRNFQPTTPSTFWSNEGQGTVAFTITIDSFDGERIAGTFSGTLPRDTGPGAAQAEFVSGQYVLTVEQ